MTKKCTILIISIMISLITMIAVPTSVMAQSRESFKTNSSATKHSHQRESNPGVEVHSPHVPNVNGTEGGYAPGQTSEQCGTYVGTCIKVTVTDGANRNGRGGNRSITYERSRYGLQPYNTP